jgi:hypothetical protein
MRVSDFVGITCNPCAMSALPYRRLDSGAIGCLAACRLSDLLSAEHEHIADTCDFLLDKCMIRGGRSLDPNRCTGGGQHVWASADKNGKRTNKHPNWT